MADRDSTTGGRRRRELLRAGGLLGAGVVAGCAGALTGTDEPSSDDGPSDDGPLSGDLTLSSFRGSGALVRDRPELSGPRIADLPDLSGSLSIYLGGGESGIYGRLIDALDRAYPDFEPNVRFGGSSSRLANTIIEESRGGEVSADLFWSIDAGSLGVVADAGLTRTLPTAVTEPVPDPYHPNDQWIGVAGRARSVPYNTEALDESDIPNDVMAFPETRRFQDVIGWAPSYGAFQAFVTAMRVLQGEARTRQWLKGIMDLGVSTYPDEWFLSNAVADGSISVGFANHYYALRVQNARPDAPIDIAFTKNGAGALVNVAGVEVMKATDNPDTAELFARHLLTVEAQEYFATRSFAYPMLPGVPPAGDLPPIDKLEPPELDLSKLSNLEPTLDLLESVGAL